MIAEKSLVDHFSMITFVIKWISFMLSQTLVLITRRVLMLADYVNIRYGHVAAFISVA